MAVVYRFRLGDLPDGRASVLITNPMLEHYGITQEQFHQDALEMAQKNEPLFIKNMDEIMYEMTNGFMEFLDEASSLLFLCICRSIVLYTKKKIHDMEHPHTGEDGAGDVQVFAEHHKKAECHEECDGEHYLDFGAPGHSLSFYVGFQIVLIEFRSHEPCMQSFRAFAKTECRQQQKGKGR